MTKLKIKKTTKAQLNALYNSFHYSLRDQQGGMKYEQIRQYKRKLEYMTEIVNELKELMQKPNHHCLKDDELMESCNRIINEHFPRFRDENPARPNGEWRKEEKEQKALSDNLIQLDFFH